MTRRRTRFLRRSLLALALGAGLGGVALLAFFPALRGAACPGCYGLVQDSPGLWVEAAMAAPDRAHLRAELAQAHGIVADFFGPAEAHLRVLACATPRCDRRLGGRGAAAVTYFLGPVSVVRLSPRGLRRTILAHELAHVETHARLGVWGQIVGRMPAWFDEGLAVIVSDDPRYLGFGEGPARCRKEPRADLPGSAFGWARAAAQDRDIYAEAACACLRWIAERGGRRALLARIAAGPGLP